MNRFKVVCPSGNIMLDDFAFDEYMRREVVTSKTRLEDILYEGSYTEQEKKDIRELFEDNGEVEF